MLRPRYGRYFAVQDEIARSIVEALRVTLRGPQSGPLVKQGTTSLEAYECFLEAGSTTRASHPPISPSRSIFKSVRFHSILRIRIRMRTWRAINWRPVFSGWSRQNRFMPARGI